MAKNDFSGLQFKAEQDVKFRDGRKMVTGSIRGNFTKPNIRKQLQEISDEFKANGVNAVMGVAMHYKNANDWTPACMEEAGKSVKLFDIEYEIYNNDTIDQLQFYIVKYDESKQAPKYHKPKKDKESVNMFLKHKK